MRGSDLAALHLQRCCRRPSRARRTIGGGGSGVPCELLRVKGYGRGEWGMLRWRASRRRRLERTGWQASGWMSEGDTSGRQAQAAVGVCVCVCWHVCCVRVFGEGGGGAHPFLKTGRSRCLTICEALARARVEGGESLPRLSYSAPSSACRPCA